MRHHCYKPAMQGLPGCVIFLLIFLIFSTPSFARSKSSPFEKGPFLHYLDGKLQVRVQGKRLKNPRLEWKLSSGQSASIPMRRDSLHYWEAEIPDEDGEYRVATDENSTDLIPILNQNMDGSSFVFVAYGGNFTGLSFPAIHRALLEEMKKHKPSLVLHTGDMVVEGGRIHFWDQFFREGAALFESVPLQPALGKHDRSRTSFHERFFDMGEGRKTYYHFSYGPAHFIALDTTRNFRPNSPQYRFLESSLKAVPPSAPLIVYLHYSPFSSTRRGSHSHVQDFLVPLFEKYGVDLVFSGRARNYQRIGPINGVTYIVTGGGGGPLQKVIPHPYLEAYKILYHFVSVEVDETLLRGKMIDPRGVVEDQFEIQAQTHPPEQIGPRPVMEETSKY